MFQEAGLTETVWKRRGDLVIFGITGWDGLNLKNSFPIWLGIESIKHKEGS
jgi:hypothetical protein